MLPYCYFAIHPAFIPTNIYELYVCIFLFFFTALSFWPDVGIPVRNQRLAWWDDSMVAERYVWSAGVVGVSLGSWFDIYYADYEESFDRLDARCMWFSSIHSLRLISCGIATRHFMCDCASGSETL